MVTATEAYDQNVLGDVNAPLQQVLQKGGEFSELTADMNYRADGRRVHFASTGGTTFRYYRDQDQFVGIGHHVGAGATVNLSRSAYSIAEPDCRLFAVISVWPVREHRGSATRTRECRQ